MITRKNLRSIVLTLVASFFAATLALNAAKPAVETIPGRWTAERAQAWYDKQPWLVGSNFYPSNAINQIEMWQESTFDPVTIERELKWSAALGMNTHRVYLHDLVWAADPEGLYKRMDRFLAICAKYGIRPSFVFFDDCHFGNPKPGPQPPPVPGYHNSGWVNSPGRELAERYADGKATEKEIANLRGYVHGTMKRFGDDPRVLYWELYNEPGRGGGFSGELGEFAQGRHNFIGERSAQLLLDSWRWAREANPSQPVCSCGLGSVGKLNVEISHANSDIISFHSYSPRKGLKETVARLRKELPGRPLICTEWLARTNGSTVADCLPYMKQERIAAINWGFVSGKSGTIWPWGSRKGKERPDALRAKGQVVKPGQPMPEPELWFHDLLRADGTPYSEDEAALFRKLTGK